MKHNFIKRIITLAIIGTSLLTVIPISASASWKQDSNGWWNTEGNSYSIGWKQIDGKWYYFNNNGYMATNTEINGYKIDNNGVWVQNITNVNNVNSNNTTNNGIVINGNVNIGNTTTTTTANNTNQNDKTRSINTNKNNIYPCWTIIDGKYYHINKNKEIDYDTIIDGYIISTDGSWKQDDSITSPNVVTIPYGYKLEAKQVIEKLQFNAKCDELRQESKDEKHKNRMEKIKELEDKIADIDKHNYNNGSEMKQKYENEIKELELEDTNNN